MDKMWEYFRDNDDIHHYKNLCLVSICPFLYIVTYQINSSTQFFFLNRKLNNKQFEIAGVILC